jgi:hypothetical protein
MNKMDDKELAIKARELISRIRRDRADFSNQINEAKKQYQDKLEEITSKQKLLYERCPHLNTKFHPDASGNNDSEYECLDCGKFAKRL